MKLHLLYTKTVCLILLISICFISQAQQTDSSGNRYATLYVYRPRTFEGSIISYDLHAGDSVICKVKNGSQHIIQLRQGGDLELWAKIGKEEKASVKINVEPGQKYYLRCDYTPTLNLVTPEQGQQEFSEANKKGAGNEVVPGDSIRPGWAYTEAPSEKYINFFSCDINGDGINDVIFTETVNYYTHFQEVSTFNHLVVKTFYGTPNGLSSKPASVFICHDSIQAISELNFDFDLNNDGMKDLLAMATVKLAGEKFTSDAIVAFYNSKQGLISPPVVLKKIGVEEEHQDFFYDYNKDGYPDLVVRSWSRGLSMVPADTYRKFRNRIMYGSANGFSDLQDINPQPGDDAFYYFIQALDYDGDKRKDLVVEHRIDRDRFEYSLRATNADSNGKWLAVEEPIMNNAGFDGSFVLGVSDDFFYQPGDINGDGYNDVCIIKTERPHNVKKNRAPSNILTIFRGSSDGLVKDTLLSYPLYDWNNTGNTFVYSIGDFDGNGSDDLFVKDHETQFVLYYDPKEITHKQSFFVWGGNPPQIDSTGDERFADFIDGNKVALSGIGDINGDKMDDLLLYNNDKQFIVYGNKERKFNPVEWIHE
jgi:hypothetical protein